MLEPDCFVVEGCTLNVLQLETLVLQSLLEALIGQLLSYQAALDSRVIGLIFSYCDAVLVTKVPARTLWCGWVSRQCGVCTVVAHSDLVVQCLQLFGLFLSFILDTPINEEQSESSTS